MSVTWNNAYYSSREKGGIYSCTAMLEDRPSECTFWASLPQNAVNWARVEQRWNGHWLRPPVGMRGYQASHVWGLMNFDCAQAWELVPRNKVPRNCYVLLSLTVVLRFEGEDLEMS